MGRETFLCEAARKRRLLLVGSGPCKVGQEELARAWRFNDAGIEVVYVEGALTPEEIAASAIQESVDLILVSRCMEKEISLRTRVNACLKQSGVDPVAIFDFRFCEETEPGITVL